MRIGSHATGVDLAAQHHLLRAFAQLSLSSERLATMRRINSGADDPAGLIAVEQLEAELAAIEEASYNASRAAGMVHVADSAMAQVGGLLNSIRSNVLAAAGGGLSDAEINAKQIEIDAALDAVNFIGNVTSYGGRKLLDGNSLSFNFSPDLGETSTLSLPHLSASALGGATGRLSDLATGQTASLTSGNLSEAVDILDEAQGQLLQARAEVGTFEKYTIESAQRVLGQMEEQISSAVSLIRDTDVAAETSQLVRSQILAEAAVSTLMLAGQRRSLIGGLL